MKAFSTCLLILGPIVVGAAAAGCSSTHSRVATDVEWLTPNRDLGRLVIVCELRGVEPAETVERKAVEVRDATSSAFAALPGTEVVDESVLSDALAEPTGWSRLSDYQAVLAGRKAGIDTICLVTMTDYGGYLSIGLLPLPGFGTWTHAGYRVRMLDVASGRLIVDTRRDRSTGGWLCIRKSAGAKADFEADLSELLAAK